MIIAILGEPFVRTALVAPRRTSLADVVRAYLNDD
jgi:hypothetical protein